MTLSILKFGDNLFCPSKKDIYSKIRSEIAMQCPFPLSMISLDLGDIQLKIWQIKRSKEQGDLSVTCTGFWKHHLAINRDIKNHK